MTGREIRGEPVDSLPHIPISMMIAADCIGERYSRYATEAEVHVRGQVEFTARWDIDHVSAISDPATEAADLGARIVDFPDQPPAVERAAHATR